MATADTSARVTHEEPTSVFALTLKASLLTFRLKSILNLFFLITLVLLNSFGIHPHIFSCGEVKNPSPDHRPLKGTPQIATGGSMELSQACTLLLLTI